MSTISQAPSAKPCWVQKNQENPRVRKILVRLSAENFHVHRIPRFSLLLGGGVFWVGGGGSADFIFMGAGIFLKKKPLRVAAIHVAT